MCFQLRPCQLLECPSVALWMLIVVLTAGTAAFACRSSEQAPTPTVEISPTAAPAPFTLLFASDRAGQGGIYRLSDSGVPQAIVTSPAGIWDPVPDPTGNRLAYTDYADANGDIFSINVDGTGRRRLTSHPADDYWPAWSPGGARIAFVSERDGGQDLYLLDLNTCTPARSGACEPTRISAGTGLSRHRYPAWSPDGRALIFAGIDTNGIGELYRLDLSSGTLTSLTSWPLKATMPAVAADGAIATIVWEEGPLRRLALLEPGADAPRVLLETTDWIGHPAWTADGRRLLFTRWTSAAGSHDVYVIPRAGGAPHRLTTGPTWDDFAVALPAAQGALPVERSQPSAPSPRKIPQEWGVNVANLDNAYLIRDLGFTWGKGFVDWSRVEPQRGEFVWVDVDNTVEGFERAGVKALLRIHNTPAWARPADTTPSHPPTDPTDLADFVSVLAARYRGRVDAYELWNEPNLAFEWGNTWPAPAGYVELLRAVHPALRAADPDAKLVAGALAVTGDGSDRAVGDLDYLRAFYAALPGDVDVYDALSLHPYGFGQPPTLPTDQALGMRRAEEHRALMNAAGDGDTPLWLTEIGWVQRAPAWDLGEHEAGALTSVRQARYWVEAAAYIEKNWAWAAVVLPFNLDFSTVPWYAAGEQMRWYALLNPDRSPRPAYSALRAWRRGDSYVEDR